MKLRYSLLLILFLFGFYSLRAQTTVATIQTSAVCGSCKKTIESSVQELKGVKSCSLNADDKKLTVKFDSAKITLDQIRQKIALSGYDADEVKADPKAYAKLDSCCKKKG